MTLQGSELLTIAMLEQPQKAQNNLHSKTQSFNHKVFVIKSAMQLRMHVKLYGNRGEKQSESHSRL